MWTLLLVSTLPLVTPFYVPGVAPMNFQQNSPVEIKVRPLFLSFFLFELQKTPTLFYSDIIVPVHCCFYSMTLDICWF